VRRADAYPVPGVPHYALSHGHGHPVPLPYQPAYFPQGPPHSQPAASAMARPRPAQRGLPAAWTAGGAVVLRAGAHEHRAAERLVWFFGHLPIPLLRPFPCRTALQALLVWAAALVCCNLLCRLSCRAAAGQSSTRKALWDL